MSAQAILNVPQRVRAGDVVEVRVLLQHPMETGFRVDSSGSRLPRDIVRHLEARFNGELVAAVELHPGVAANPYLAFSLRVDAAGELQLNWRGDKGFAHTQTARIELI